MSTLFSELDQNISNAGNIMEEQRTLKLALELSMLSFDSFNGSDLNVNMLSQHQQQHPSSLGSPNGFNPLQMLPMDDRSKKSQNMTECVPVPSSEHVAEIVGRQGCKIKALRAKTNTYIKTPVRGEEPVFVVTGRKEDVAKAKREILSAAEHFSLIRASRKPTLGGLSGKGTPPGPPANIPGQITIQVLVPYRVVGLVVGPKGATIKHIQQQTHTYIVTPSREKEPVFEVTGMPDNVQSARQQIEAHIALRTGNSSTINGNGTLLDDDNTPLLALYKNGFNSLFNGYLDNTTDTFCNLASSTGSSTCDSSSSSTSSKSAIIPNIWKSIGESVDLDEGLGDSPNIWSMTTPSAIGSRSSPSASASPTDSLLAGAACKRECLVCGDKEVTAALVPCGHSIGLECANRICSTGDSACPICSRTVVQAIRILN